MPKRIEIQPAPNAMARIEVYVTWAGVSRRTSMTEALPIHAARVRARKMADAIVPIVDHTIEGSSTPEDAPQ